HAVTRRHIEIVPGRLPFTRGEKRPGFGQTVEMDHLDAQSLHIAQHSRCWWGSTSADANTWRQAILACSRKGGQRDQHGGGGTGQRDAFLLHKLENALGLNFAQTDLRATATSQSPDAAPAIGVKHW